MPCIRSVTQVESLTTTVIVAQQSNARVAVTWRSHSRNTFTYIVWQVEALLPSDQYVGEQLSAFASMYLRL